MATLTCQCGHTLTYGAHLAGKRAKCPSCGATVFLPITKDEPGQTEAETDDAYGVEAPIVATVRPPGAPQPKQPAGAEENSVAAFDAYDLGEGGTGAEGAIPYHKRVQFKAPPSEEVPVGEHVAPVVAPPSVHDEEPEPEIDADRPNFWLALPTVPIYPFRGNGFFLMLCGVAFFTGMWALANYLLVLRRMHLAPYFINIGRAIAYVVLSGYLAGYAMRIIFESGLGDKTPPNWPDLTELIDAAIKPLLYFLTIGAISFGGMWAYGRYAKPVHPSVMIALKAWGCFYAPMGVLAISVFRDPRSLIPWYVLKAIVLVAPRYLATWILTLLAWQGMTRLVAMIEKPKGYALGSHALFFTIAIYFVLVIARALGVLYYTSPRQLKWLEE